MTTLSDFVNSGASNQAQVDANTNAIKLLPGRNRIINGHMVISQRGTSFPAVSNAAYTLDRWLVAYGNSAVRTVSQDADYPTAMGTVLNSLKYLVTTADASIGSSEYELLIQVIEGHNVRQFIGRTFTLSFWVKSSKVGIYSVSFRNTAADNSYVAEYTINSANTWEKKTITVIGGIPATLITDVGTGAGMRLGFCLACGSGLATTPGSWKPAGYYGSVNQVNLLDTISATFFLTGVQIELGEQATEFELKSVPDEIFSCQRFFYRSPNTILTSLNPQSATFVSFVKALPSRMRATPTITFNPNLIDANYVGLSPVTGVQWTANQAGGGTTSKTGTATFGFNISVEQVQIVIGGANFNTPISRLQVAAGSYIFDASAEL